MIGGGSIVGRCWQRECPQTHQWGAKNPTGNCRLTPKSESPKPRCRPSAWVVALEPRSKHRWGVKNPAGNCRSTPTNANR